MVERRASMWPQKAPGQVGSIPAPPHNTTRREFAMAPYGDLCPDGYPLQLWAWWPDRWGGGIGRRLLRKGLGKTRTQHRVNADVKLSYARPTAICLVGNCKSSPPSTRYRYVRSSDFLGWELSGSLDREYLVVGAGKGLNPAMAPSSPRDVKPRHLKAGGKAKSRSLFSCFQVRDMSRNRLRGFL